jgi:hypothetical protein
MTRTPDHIVHAVRDLDALAAFYRRAGFVVGARNRHPWGTHNHVVQVPGFFVELLSVAEPDKLGPDGLSEQFGRFNQKAIASGDGLSMLLLASGDAAFDAREWARAGIGCSDVLPFSRTATLADGTTATVGFSLAFAREEGSPAGFAACQHRNPAAFWSPALQAHDNGAVGLAAVVMTAAKPSAHGAFLSALLGLPAAEEGPDRWIARTAGGDVVVLTPERFATRYGIAPRHPANGLQLAAVEFRVADLDRCGKVLHGNGVAISGFDGGIAVAPELAFGAALLFRA